MKRNTLKRAAYLALGSALLVTSVAGCSKSSSAGSSAGGDTSKESQGGSSKEETLTLDVFDSQANYQGMQSGWYADYIKNKFNIELNIIAPNVAGGGDTLFQTRSANGNLGDIIITNLDQSRLKDMVEAGLIMDMTDYMDSCPNLSRYKSVIEAASSLAEKDGLWAVPSEVSNQSATEPCDAQEPTVAPSIRWDIYAEIGYPEMKDLDDFMNVLELMQEKAREEEDGKQIYAISLFKDWDGDIVQNADGIKGLYGYQQMGFCMAKVDGSEIQSVIDDDGIYVKTLKFFYEANQRGLVDPESTTQNFDTLSSKYKNGQVLYSLWPWLGAGQYNTAENTAEGKGFATAVIGDMQSLTYGSMPDGKMGCGIMIGSKTKDPQRVAEFIDWLYSPEGVMISNVVQSNACGPEGLTWEMKDGKPVLTEFGIDAFVNKKSDLKVPEEWGGGSWSDGQCALNYKSVGLVDTNPETGMCYTYLKWEDYISRTSTKLSQDWAAHYDTKGTSIDLLKASDKLLVLPGTNYAAPEYSTDVATIKEQCKQIIVEYSWKMMFASNDDEFNSLLDEMQDTVNGLGYEQVLAVDTQNCKDEFAAFDKVKSANK